MKKLLGWLITLALMAAGAGWLHKRGIITLPFAEKIDWLKPDTRMPAQAGGRRFAPREQVVPVLVADVKRDNVPVVVESVGTAQAANAVVVRTQADGRLIAVLFREGQDVKKGDILARIDPATYQAAYDQAVAKKAQDEATLANARRDLERYNALAKGAYGSQQQADTQKALVAQLTAQVQLDQASIDNAKAILDYTTIRAPIDGRTGIRQVDEGNIVRGSDANGLVSIAQVKPIAVVFTLPQQQLRDVMAALGRGPVAVEVLDGERRSVVDRGQIAVVDNQIDPTTGTVKVKAIFPNDGLALWPGQFVTVRIVTQVLENVVVVPSAAVQRGPNGAYVYVAENDEAKMREIVVGRQTGTLAVVTKGLDAPSRVVTSGFSRLDDGTAIAPSEPAERDAAGKDAPAKTDGSAPAAPAGAAPAEGQTRPQGQRGAGQGRQGGGMGGMGGQRQRQQDQPPAQGSNASPAQGNNASPAQGNNASPAQGSNASPAQGNNASPPPPPISGTPSVPPPPPTGAPAAPAQ